MISATQAYDKATENNEWQYKMYLEWIDKYIHEAANKGQVACQITIDVPLGIANKLFDKLVKGLGYGVTQSKSSNGWNFQINWEHRGEDDSRYVLPVDEVYNEYYGQMFAYHTESGWAFHYADSVKDAVELGYTVTSKDLLEAPEWVLALEPEEV